MLQLQLQLGARDACDVAGFCVFKRRVTDGLTVSVSISRLALLITLCNLQSVGMASFTGISTKMASIYFTRINSTENIPTIHHRSGKITFVSIDLDYKL